MPPIVVNALDRAAAAGFTMSCEPTVGRFLAVLSAAVPVGGRILEMGTGIGVGTAWIVAGLDNRSDVEVITIERDRATASLAEVERWPSYVHVIVDDVLHALPQLGQFDFIFADSQGGKWEGLDQTINSLAAGGHLLVDDMAPASWLLPEQPQRSEAVRRTLIHAPELVAVELNVSSGMILATRRR